MDEQDRQRKASYDQGSLQLDGAKLLSENQRSRQEAVLKAAQVAIERRRLEFEMHRDMGMLPQQQDMQTMGNQLAQHVAQHVGQLGQTLHQRLNEIAGNADVHRQRLEGGLLHMANHLNAPRRVVRDAQGNPTHIAHDTSQGAATLDEALGRMGTPRSIARGGNGRIEGAH